MSGLHYSLLN